MHVVLMNRIRSARRIHHSDHQTFLAGKICKILRQARRHLSVLRDQGAGNEKSGANRNRELFLMVRLRWTYARCMPAVATCFVA